MLGQRKVLEVNGCFFKRLKDNPRQPATFHLFTITMSYSAKVKIFSILDTDVVSLENLAPRGKYLVVS
jgi:hypothetical protein